MLNKYRLKTVVLVSDGNGEATLNNVRGLFNIIDYVSISEQKSKTMYDKHQRFQAVAGSFMYNLDILNTYDDAKLNGRIVLNVTANTTIQITVIEWLK